MKFTIERHGAAHVIRVQGDLTGTDTRSFLEAVTTLLSGPGAKIVLDLAGVPFMNSLGLGELVRLVAQGNVQEARVVLANPSAFVAGVLQTTQLDRFFEIFPTLEAALGTLRA